MSRRRNPMRRMSKKVHENVNPTNYDSPLPDLILENAYKLYIPMTAAGVVFVLFYLFSSFDISLFLFIPIAIPSVLAHEYGHYTAFSHYGVSSELYLAIFGGYVKPKGRRAGLSTRKRMNITIMGCTVNYIIAAVSFLVSAVFFFAGTPVLFKLFFAVGMVNIFLGGFNLIIPIGISDGSQLYKLWKKRRNKSNQTGVPPKYRRGR